MQTLHEYPLTPSEIVLLSEKVSSDPSESCERRMLAAAFIANEKVGAIRLEVHSRKVIRGLLTISSELLVVPRRRAIEWPHSSLEANVPKIAKELSDRGRKNRVSAIVYEWMRADSNRLYASAFIKVKEQLVRRGLLKKVEGEIWRLGLIGGRYRCSIPTATLDIISQMPLSQISRMISDFERTRPDLWQRLFNEVRGGVVGVDMWDGM